MAASSAADLEPVVNVIRRLRNLLERARQVKPADTVDPPLPTADLLEEVESLHDDFDEKYDQSSRFLTIEAAARDLFYSFITSADINEPAFAQVWNLLDIVLICGDLERCAPELVCWLLEELLDSQTTHGCRTVFDYLDSRRERLAQKDFHKKNLVFLRSCNELLRRLSRAEDAIFCGRVFFFLFQTFPLGDKSSVNLRGEFHTDNVTKFEELEPRPEDGDSNEMQLDTKPEEPPAKDEGTPQPASGKPGSKAVPIKAPPPKKAPEEEVLSNSELYPIFWRLQHDFSDPTRLFSTPNFTAFKKGLASTITKFRNTKTVVQTKAGEEDSRGTKRKHGEEDGTTTNGMEEGDDHLVDNYNPKYLTSRDLFDLEVSDLAFQRHILVQALILIDFLLSLTEKAKKKLSQTPTNNKSMLHAFTLSDDDTKWATTTRSSITAYLGNTAEGRQYCRMVETVLARDKNWVRWKVENCPSMVRGPVSADMELEARKGARNASRPPRAMPPSNPMDLSFLEEGSGGGLEALKNPSRYTAPTIEELVEAVKVDKLDLDFADGDEREMLTNRIQGAAWRALRQARAKDLSILDKVESTKDLEEMWEMLKQTEQSSGEAEAIEQNGNGNGPETETEPGIVTVTDDGGEVAADDPSEPLPLPPSTLTEDKTMQDVETK